MSVRVVILEDNLIDMENLRILLEVRGDCSLVGVATSVKEGLTLIDEERPDLILTDVQLGQDISLNHLDSLDYAPTIICTTLYDQHALQAYDVGAVDYLLKPITAKKLERALERFSGNEEAYGATLLRVGKTTKVTPIDQILMVSADGDYTTVIDLSGLEILCGRKMREWTELLPEELFLSLDRSTIVNWNQVDRFTKLSDAKRASVFFKNGHEIEIGATALARLQRVFN